MRACLTRHIIYPLYQLGTGRRILPKLRELEASQWLSPAEIRDLENDRLQRLLVHAYHNVPFYHDRFEAAGLTPVDLGRPTVMARIPPLTKQDIRRHGQEIIAANADPRRLHANSTGGSTGEPVAFYNDQTDLDYGSAVTLRNLGWSGLELGDTHVKLWGSPFDLSRYQSLRGRLANWVLNRHILPAFKLSRHKLDEYVSTIHRLNPRLITGYASALELLAKYILETGTRFQPEGLRGVASTAETLYPHRRALMERAFGCPVFDRYGSREVGQVAYECDHHRRHINAENVYVEVVRDGEPVPAGEPGQLAITALNNFGFPFIRYLIGDAGALSEEACPCGRGLPVLGELLGRTHDILVTSDGRFVPGEFFPHLMKEISAVRQFQVIQETGRLILIRLVIDESYDRSDERFLLQKTRQVLGQEIDIAIEVVDELPRLPSGKLRYTISEVPVDFTQQVQPSADHG